MNFYNGALPICPIPLADEWDGETYWNGIPSASSDEYKIVRGQGTYYPTGPMSLEDICKLYWGTDKSKLTMSGWNWEAFADDIPGPPEKEGLVGQRTFTFDYEGTIFPRDYRTQDAADGRYCGWGDDSGIPFFSSPDPLPDPDTHTNYAEVPTVGNESDFGIDLATHTELFKDLFIQDPDDPDELLMIFQRVVKDSDGNYYPYFRFYVPFAALGNFYHDWEPGEYDDGNGGTREWLPSFNIMAFDTLRMEGQDYDDREYGTKLRFYENDLDSVPITLYMLDTEDNGPKWPEIGDIAIDRNDDD